MLEIDPVERTVEAALVDEGRHVERRLLLAEAFQLGLRLRLELGSR